MLRHNNSYTNRSIMKTKEYKTHIYNDNISPMDTLQVRPPKKEPVESVSYPPCTQ